MKRTRWNPRKFLNTVNNILGVILISIILAYGLLWGLSKEVDIQSNQVKNFLK